MIVPDGITRIGRGAFRGCSSLSSVHIPDSVGRIARDAFVECDQLAYALVPKACIIEADAFPESCEIFNDISEFRAQLAKTIADDRAHDGVEIVGMQQPAEQIAVDCRGGPCESRCGRLI